MSVCLTCLSICLDISTPECAQLDVRLTFREQGGAIGNLEICVNNTWLAIDRPSPNLLPVACRALGFTDLQTGVVLVSNVINPQLLPPPYLANELVCQGVEQNLRDCQATGGTSLPLPLIPLRISCPGMSLFIIRHLCNDHVLLNPAHDSKYVLSNFYTTPVIVSLPNNFCTIAWNENTLSEVLA
jgi:hypothetical protein